nr:MAG TPA: hypothetical protein [Caudoviricetes sp.]
MSACKGQISPIAILVTTTKQLLLLLAPPLVTVALYR